MVNKKIVTTNLRIPEDDLARARVIAAEENMSLNEYVMRLIRMANRNSGIVTQLSYKSDKQNLIEEVNRIAKMPNRPMDLSEEDKLIYGT